MNTPLDTTLAMDLIEKLAPACRHHGIRRIKVGDVEIEFGAESVDADKLADFKRVLDQGVPTDDEVMNWSAPGFIPPEAPGPAVPTARASRKK